MGGYFHGEFVRGKRIFHERRVGFPSIIEKMMIRN